MKPLRSRIPYAPRLLAAICGIALSPHAARAYDNYTDSASDVGQAGLPFRFLLDDIVEDGNTDDLSFASQAGDDHLASIAANLNFSAFRQSYESGDFDGNGCIDLAIGVPYASTDGQEATGKLLVYYFEPKPGDPDSLCTGSCKPTCAQRGAVEYIAGGKRGAAFDEWRSFPNDAGGRATPDAGSFIGFSLASGDFNCDGLPDLAVGAPGNDLGTCDALACINNAGAVFVGYGTRAHGLDFDREPSSGEHIRQYAVWGESSVPAKYKLPTTQPYDHNGRHFAMAGFSLAAGNVYGTNGQCDDLIIGQPGQDTAGDFLEAGGNGAGSIIVVAGHNFGLSAAHYSRVFLEKDFTSVGGESHRGHVFGFSVAAGRFNSPDTNPSYDSIAIGTPGVNHERGRVYILRGGTLGPTIPSGNQACLDAEGGACLNLNNAPEDGDRLGFALATGDFNGDHYEDLAIGVPGESVGNAPDAGAVELAKGYITQASPPSLIACTARTLRRASVCLRTRLVTTARDSRWPWPISTTTASTTF